MELQMNPVKAAFAARRPTFGLWSMLPHPLAVEGLAAMGFDWLVIDTEHTAVTVPQVMGLMQAVAGWPCHAAVRPGWNDAVEIKRLLDAGAQTLIVPYVQTADEAARAVAAVRYPPQGTRGVAGITRASGFGLIGGYVKTANEQICLIVQVETAEALERIEEIAAVDGVDGLFIGPSDLAASMGYPGEPGHPQVRRAVLDAIARISRTGRAPGLLSPDQGLMRDAVSAGSLFNGVGIDTALLFGAATALRAAWR